MRIVSWTPRFVIAAFAIVALVAGGCGQGGADAEAEHASQEAGHDHDGEDGHNLHGFWCVEHGVPDGICAQCSKKLAADFQQKGDWCEKHNRPDSQCFVCHPELEAKFAAQYEAKFGEKPPERTAEHEDHETHEHDEHGHES